MKFEKDGAATLIVAGDGTKVARIEVFGEVDAYALNAAGGINTFEGAMEAATVGVLETLKSRAPNRTMTVEVRVDRQGEGCVVAFAGRA